MKSGGAKFSLGEVTAELRKRDFHVSDNSSDLSGVLNWLRVAGVLKDYSLDEEKYSELAAVSRELHHHAPGSARSRAAHCNPWP
jgi:hypothetical protein